MYSTSLIGARSARSRLIWTTSMALLAAALIGSHSQASITLPLPSPEPDAWSDMAGMVTAGFSYDADTGLFTQITGVINALEIGASGPSYFPFGAMFSISSLSTSGSVSGNFAVTMMNPGMTLIPYTGVMLQGLITDVQFNGTGVLEMGFDIIGGSAAADFGTIGALRIGIGGGPDSLAADFSVSGGKTIDVFGTVPEPTSLAVFAGIIMANVLARPTRAFVLLL